VTYLPAESGSWGALLPLPGQASVLHEPDAFNYVAEINPAFVRFSSTGMLGFRAWEFFFFATLGVTVFLGYGFLMLIGLKNPQPLEAFPLIVVWTVYIALTVGPLAFAYRCARQPLNPPIILSRRDRRLYYYDTGRGQWWKLNYDQMVPAVMRHRSFNMGGAISMYSLRLHHIYPDDPTRYIHDFHAVGDPFLSPDAAGQVWEFIRRYMDGPPEAVPAVKLLPDLSDPRAWMAIADRTLLAGYVDEHHRVRKGLGRSGAWFFGTVEYWGLRAGSWIWRTAPRHFLSPAVEAALQWEGGANPYRIAPLSDIERQAFEGTLPHMRRRWRICGVASTILFSVWMGALPLFGFISFYTYEPPACEPQQENCTPEPSTLPATAGAG
jgi:hypothetical protein